MIKKQGRLHKMEIMTEIDKKRDRNGKESDGFLKIGKHSLDLG